MNDRPTLLTSSLALVLVSCLGAAPTHPQFEVLASTRRITALEAQGDQVLVGTTGGLVLWDPLTGTRQLLLPGLPVRALAVDPGPSARVVVASDAGTWSLGEAGLERLDQEPAQALLLEPFRLLTGHPAGLVRVREDSGPARELHVPTASPVHSLLLDRGALLAASVEGIWRLEGEAFVAESLPGGAMTRSVTRLECVGDRVLAGTPAGLYERLDGGTWQAVEPASSLFVTDLLDSDVGVLVASAGDGVQRLGPRGTQPHGPGRWSSWVEGQPAPPDLGHATAVLRHRGATLVGTHHQGLWVMGDHPTPAWDLREEPPGNTITSLAYAEDYGTLVVGSFEQGVGLLQQGGWRHFGAGEAFLPSSWVNQVASDGSRVLVRFSDGSVFTQIERERFRELGKGDGWPKDWTSGLGTSGARQWVGTRNAYYYRDRGSWRVRTPKPDLQGKLVLDVAFDGDVTWLATHRSGVLRGAADGKSWQQFTLGSGLTDPWVTSVEVLDGEVWAGTFDGGLARLPTSEPAPESWIRYRADDPEARIPSDGIQCLLATDEGLWIGSFGGLTWTDGESWRSYGPEHGLPSRSVLSLTVGDGSLWVGTDSGLARADLEDLKGDS